MATELSNTKRTGHVLKYEMHPAHCRTSGPFKSVGALAAVSICGQPVKLSGLNWIPVLAGDEANAGGICLYQELVTLDATTVLGVPVGVLNRGPAGVQKTELPDNDVAGDAFNKDTLETRLLVLGIKCMLSPVETTIQVE